MKFKVVSDFEPKGDGFWNRKLELPVYKPAFPARLRDGASGR
jgi:hypothetical protein